MDMGGTMEMEMEEMEMDTGSGGMGGMSGRFGQARPKEEEEEKPIDLLQFDFQLQFVWQKTPPSARHDPAGAAGEEVAVVGEESDTTESESSQ